MADSAVVDDRPSSPEVPTRCTRRERRKSGSKSPATTDASAREPLAPPKKHQSQSERYPRLSTLPAFREETAAGSSTLIENDQPLPPTPASSNQHGQKLVFRRPRLPSHADGEDDTTTKRDLNIVLHDISQSMWIEDTKDHSMERVYLTTEAAALEQMLTIDTSFSWIHHERTPEPMQFEDFVRILDNSPGLYPHEHDAAAKALEEVKHMRHVFARGRYFDPLVHQVKETHEVGGQKTEVKATFISIPIFCAMRSQEPEFEHHHDYGFLRKPFQSLFERTHRMVHEEEYSRNRHRDLASKELRMRNDHPIRSLMQYANILALDNSRDGQQAVLRLEDEDGSQQPFIHVPEFWALIINNYTIITCAPFTVNHLLGENVKLRAPPAQDRRAMVKYTNSNGALHEFRCRTWIGLLDIISRIEKHIDQTEELSVLLQKGESDYKLVDSTFCEMDRKQWINLTATDEEVPSCVYLRLLKVSKDDKFNLAYSRRMLAVDRRLVFQLVTFQVMIERLQQELRDARSKRGGTRRIVKLESTSRSMRLEQQKLRRRRVSQRYWLMAVRYHLIDPHGLLFDEDETYLEAVRNRKPIRRTQSSVSGSVADGRSQSPPPPEPALSRQATNLASTLEVSETGLSTNVHPSARFENESTNAKNLENREAVLAQQVIQRMRIPQRRTANPSSCADMEGRPPLHVSPDAVQEVNARFQPPRRSKTSQSLIPARPSSPILQKSRTLGPGSDIEAQDRTRRKPKRISFAPEPLDHLIIPTFTIQGESKRPVPRVFHAGPMSRKPPYIFRQNTELKGSSFPSSTAVTPQRLPPTHRVVNQLSVGQDRPSSRSEAHHGRSQAKGLVVSRLEAHRKEKDMKCLQPFFQWRAAAVTPSTPRASDIDHTTPDVQTENGSPYPNADHDGIGSTVGETLEILHLEMLTPYQASEDFAIQPQHYVEVNEKTLNDVIRALEDQASGLRFHARPEHLSEEQRFWQTKLGIVMKVDTILGCFIGSNELPNLILKKIWGIVFQICQITLEEVRKTSQSFPFCGHKPLTWADRELAAIERVSHEILVSARSDTGNTVEQMDLPLPPSFKSLFRDIVLFLLSISLVARDSKTFASAADKCCNAVDDGLGECETALLRTAREQKEHSDHAEFMHESIRTADTLLGLLLQNAFAVACSDKAMTGLGQSDGFFCDIEHIYRRWTSVCHERAIREASAEMYEEVRLLREELDTITAIYKAQKRVIDKTLQMRESPKTKLDSRIQKRTQTFLDDMIKHFKTLRTYAEEAETLTTNYIRVSNEDNSKAIYIFTTVTVIFLPLNAVSSVLGMNLVDIRTTNRGSSLFWEIAMPVTIAVLVLCLLLVRLRFKFKLRRKFGRVLLKLFPKHWAREHMQATRDLPRL